MSIKKKAIQGVIFNWMGRGSSFIIMFFMTPYLIRTLGDEPYGIWIIVTSLASYYALTDMGIRGATTKYIAQYASVKDSESVNKVIMTSMIAYTALACVLTVATYCVALAFPFFFPALSYQSEVIRPVILLSGFTVSLRFFGQVFGSIIVAYRRFDLSNFIAVSTQLVQALGIYFSLQAGGGLLGMAWVVFGVGLLTVLIECFFSRQLLDGGFPHWKNCNLQTLKIIYRFGLASTLARIAGRLSEQMGNIIIGVIEGPAVVSFYAIPASLEQKARSISKSVNRVIFPLSSHLDAQGSEKIMHQIMTVVPRFLFAYSLIIASIFWVMGHSILKLWIDLSYANKGFPVLLILSIASVADMSSNSLRALLRGKEKLDLLVKLSVFDLILIVILGGICANLIGITGMAIAVAISKVLISGIVLPYCTCEVMHYPYYTYLKKVFIPGLIAAIPPLLSAIILSNYFKPLRLSVLVFQISIVFFIATPSVLFSCFDYNQRSSIFSSIYNIFRKN